MQKKTYFPNLDALRFIAALMVFGAHRVNGLYELSKINVPFIGRIWNLMCDGYLGVILFFVLSGFLITYILLEEKELTNKINVKNFYIRRVLRIWPLYFAVLPIGFIIYPLIYHLPGILTSVTTRMPYYVSFLSNFEAISMYKNNLVDDNNVRLMQGVTWSVSVEEQFYLIWPLLFLLINPRFYSWIFISAIIGSLAFRIYFQNDYWVLILNTLSVIIDLAIGGLSAYLVLKYRSFKDFFFRIPAWGSFLIYVTCFALLICRGNIIYTFTYGKAFIHIMYGIIFSFVILHQNFSPNSFLKLGRYKFISFWGKYSYGMYLLHPVAIGIVGYFVYQIHINESTFTHDLIIGICSLAVTLALSYVSYEFYEKRFLKLKKKYSVIVRE